MTDTFFAAVFAGLAVLTWGLLVLCDWLMGGNS
jgi:hypothetical protein